MHFFQEKLKIFAKKFGSLKKVRTFAIPNKKNGSHAEIAQLVEHNLAKVRVASSSLVFRSKTGHLRMTLNFANRPTGFNHMSVVLVHKGRLFCFYTSRFFRSTAYKNSKAGLNGVPPAAS